MITIFTGDDRVKIQAEIKKLLGSDYEIFDGEDLQISDIYNICQGNSLFETSRKILIKDLTPARKNDGNGAEMGKNVADPYEVFLQFLDTKHTIVIWESNVPNRKSYKDFAKKVEVRKYQKEEVNKWATFRIIDIAYTDGKRAVTELDKLLRTAETGGEVKMLDPYLMVGAFSSSALKKFEQSPTVKNKKVLKELSKLDMQMKTSRIEPWTLIKMFLLKVEKL
ncbi:hypothetical protein IJ098_02875 [Candidatus Saccharibacteria bacterium]|nr:hypothetical protein [Candidatus Saccharibacteria bacterium]